MGGSKHWGLQTIGCPIENHEIWITWDCHPGHRGHRPWSQQGAWALYQPNLENVGKDLGRLRSLRCFVKNAERLKTETPKFSKSAISDKSQNSQRKEQPDGTCNIQQLGFQRGVAAFQLPAISKLCCCPSGESRVPESQRPSPEFGLLGVLQCIVQHLGSETASESTCFLRCISENCDCIRSV